MEGPDKLETAEGASPCLLISCYGVLGVTAEVSLKNEVAASGIWGDGMGKA